MARSILFIVAMLFLVLPAGEARSQQYDDFGNLCDGQWADNGNGGKGCLCPDGSWANGEMEGNLVHSVCASAGARDNYRPRRPAGIDCGDWTCPPGFYCSRKSYGQCVQNGATECPSGTICGDGYQCGSGGNTCLPIGNTECGNGSCPSDKKCSRDERHCLDKEAVDCNSYFCKEGEKCGSGKQCLASDADDCHDGKSCSAGYVCRRDGGCATPEQLAAEQDAAAKQKKAELDREKAEALKAAKDKSNPTGAILNPDLKNIKSLPPPSDPAELQQSKSSADPYPRACSTFGGKDATLDKYRCPKPTATQSVQSGRKVNSTGDNPFLGTPASKKAAAERDAAEENARFKAERAAAANRYTDTKRKRECTPLWKRLGIDQQCMFGSNAGKKWCQDCDYRRECTSRWGLDDCGEWKKMSCTNGSCE